MIVIMEYSLRAMELWFHHSPGSLLLELESQLIAQWFSKNSGTHCLQIGGPSDLSLIKSAHYPHKVYLSTQFASATHASRIQTDLEILPITSNSIDVVVLAHLLEFAPSPQALLEEIYRILTPAGQLLLLTFNPWSLWGITRLKRRKQGFPWAGKFYSNGKIKHWLQQAEYHIVSNKTLCFQPFLQNAHHCKRWSFLEWVGPFCLPGFGAVSLTIAKKQEIGMTPVKAKWSHRSNVKIGRRVVEPTTYH